MLLLLMIIDAIITIIYYCRCAELRVMLPRRVMGDGCWRRVYISRVASVGCHGGAISMSPLRRAGYAKILYDGVEGAIYTQRGASMSPAIYRHAFVR